MALIKLTQDEFKSNFALTNKYGEREPAWPRNTVLLYKCILTKSDKSENEMTWTKVLNISNRGSPDDGHCEIGLINALDGIITMIQCPCELTVDQIRNVLGGYQIINNENNGYDLISFLRTGSKTIERLQLEMVISYSPCFACADRLIKFRRRLEADDIWVSISIRIANFYKSYEARQLTCLCRLHENNFVLEVFDWNYWRVYLRKCMPDFDEDTHFMMYRNGREERDQIDAYILETVKVTFKFEVFYKFKQNGFIKFGHPKWTEIGNSKTAEDSDKLWTMISGCYKHIYNIFNTCPEGNLIKIRDLIRRRIEDTDISISRSIGSYSHQLQ